MSLKQNQRNGTRSNTSYDKEDLVTTHKKSKIDLNDERSKKIIINITHHRRCPDGMNKIIQAFELESETKKWVRDGYSVELIN